MGKPNFLLIYLDCLRKDRLAIMPKTKRLLRKPGWATFANHRAVAHCSDPNFVTILTGLPPDTTQVHTQMGHKYTKVFPTLPVTLHNRGWYTFMYGPLNAPGFYRHGCDACIQHKSADVSPVGAPAIKNAIREAGTAPWFAFLRVMDTHYPFMHRPLPEDRYNIPSQYDESVRHVDKFTAFTIQWVLQNYPNTVIILGNDHGEMLGELGLWDHLFTLKEALVQCLLFVHVPGQPARFTDARTQHTCVANIVRGAAGIHDSEEWDWLTGQRSELPGLDTVWYSAWGAAARDDWKHRALSVTSAGKEYKYTVNWSLFDGIYHELHIDGNEKINYFGQNGPTEQLVAMMAERYPLSPKPDLGLVQPAVPLMVAAKSTPLGDGQL